MEFKKLSVFKLFFQHCKYPPCCFIRLFCDPFQSSQANMEVVGLEANVNQQIFLLSLLGGWWEMFFMLSRGKTMLWTKPVWLTIWTAQERNNLMHFLSFSALFSCLLLFEGSVQRLNVLLKQYMKFCSKMLNTVPKLYAQHCLPAFLSLFLVAEQYA